MPSIDLGNVVGPKGDKGDTGPQGLQGIQGIQGPAGYGVIPGGAENSFLAKNSAVDYDTKWMTLPQIGSELVKTDNPVGAALSGKASNPNLLDNWYFADPINQRGKTSYTDGYGIDRWRGVGVTMTTFSDGLQLTFKHQYASFNHLIELLPPGTYTFSVLFDTQSDALYAEYYADGGTRVWLGSFNQTLSYFTFSTSTFLQNFRVTIVNASDSVVTSKLKAAKLEFGSIQTLAHQDADGNWVLNDPPPNKALELAKCQRYQKVYVNSDCVGTSIGNIILIQKPCMRVNATVIQNGALLAVGGVEYNVNTLTIENARANGAFAVCGGQNDFGTGAVFVKYDSPEPLILDANL